MRDGWEFALQERQIKTLEEALVIYADALEVVDEISEGRPRTDLKTAAREFKAAERRLVSIAKKIKEGKSYVG